MSPNQTTILHWIVENGAPMGASDIVRKCQLVSAEAGRKNILSCLGKLMQKKLVERANSRAAFADRTEPLYRATKAGRAFAASGRRITSGPNAPLAAPRSRGNTFRERLWNAFRISRKATLPQLIEIARERRDGNVEANALAYMRALVRAGVAARLPTREPGVAVTSNGHLRFALIKDLGPKAPQAGKTHLINLNAQCDAECFIAYRDAR